MRETSHFDNHIAVVGAGTMGAGIAQKYASSGYFVTVVERNENCLLGAKKNIKNTLDQAVSKRIFNQEEANLIFERLHFTREISDTSKACLVIEAIFEDFLAKKALFQHIEGIVSSQAILATNTSSFSVADLQNGLKYPERFLGLHYFFHPAKNRLVEVISTQKTSSDITQQVCSIQENIKKIIITSKDAPGFIVNRFFVPWLNEAVRIFGENKANIATIEHAAKSFFKIPMGPFELMNVTGIPITMHAANAMASRLGEFYSPCPLISLQVAKNEAWSLRGDVDESKANYVAERLFAVVSALSCQIVFEEEVGGIYEVDLGARVGLLWPQGPFELINQHAVKLSSFISTSHAEIGLKVPEILREHLAIKKAFPNPCIEIIYDEEIAIVKLNRPDTMNALDIGLKDELAQAFTHLEHDPSVKGIILSGHRRAFMAGADLGFFNNKIASNQIDQIVSFAASTQELFLRIDRSPKPVVAAISGLALGGGLELALCCDKIVATIDAKLGFPETGIGIYPGLGGTQRTPLRIGPELARFLVLTGTLLSGTEAKVIGLVDECSNVDDLIDDAKSLVRSILSNRHAKEIPSADVFKDLRQAFRGPLKETKIDSTMSERARKALERVNKKAPLAVKAADDLISHAHKGHLEEGLSLEIAGLEKIFKSDDAKIGLKGAATKTPVQFSGR